MLTPYFKCVNIVLHQKTGGKIMDNKQMSIKALRVNNGYTQEALAQKLGVNVKTISEWENNKVEVKPLTIFAIAYVFKVDADIIRL